MKRDRREWNATGATLEFDKATLASAAETKRCVLICPGGAYRFVSSRESWPVAERFASAGWTPFILTYSVGENLQTKPLTEAAWAVRTVRELVPGAFVAVCGFSAGGHLASSRAHLTFVKSIISCLVPCFSG